MTFSGATPHLHKPRPLVYTLFVTGQGGCVHKIWRIGQGGCVHKICTPRVIWSITTVIRSVNSVLHDSPVGKGAAILSNRGRVRIPTLPYRFNSKEPSQIQNISQLAFPRFNINDL